MTPEMIMIASAVLNAAVTVGAVRFALRYVLRELNRAHRRLDELDAPACTEEHALDIF